MVFQEKFSIVFFEYSNQLLEKNVFLIFILE